MYVFPGFQSASSMNVSLLGFDCCCRLNAHGVEFDVALGAAESGRGVASTPEIEAVPTSCDKF